MDIAYALPPKSKKLDGDLARLRQFTDDLCKGQTDSGGVCHVRSGNAEGRLHSLRSKPHRHEEEWPAGGNRWLSVNDGPQLASSPWPAPPPPMQPSPRVQALRKLPRLENYGKSAAAAVLPGFGEAAPFVAKPLQDRRSLAVNIPPAYQAGLDFSQSPSAPSRSAPPPRRGDVAAIPGCCAGGRGGLESALWVPSLRPSQANVATPVPPWLRGSSGRAAASPAARWRAGSCDRLQQAEVDDIKVLPKAVVTPRPPPRPKPKSLEDYVMKAVAEMPSCPLLTWCTTDSDNAYRQLRPGEFFNHFQNNKELTTKSGLSNALAQHSVATAGAADVDSFFPRSYDVTQKSEREDFVLDFRRSAALTVALLHLRLAEQAAGRLGDDAEGQYTCNASVLQTAAWTLRAWCCELDPAYFTDEASGEKVPPSPNDAAWDAMVLYSEFTEAQLSGNSCQKAQAELLNKHPRRRFYRIGGTRLEDEDGQPAPQNQAAGKRPADVTQWPEFRGQTWLPGAQLAVNEKLGDAVAKLEHLFPQWLLQGGWSGRNVWIVKPGTCSKGSGIECLNTLPELLHHCDTMTNRIVQKYIEKPLLLFSGRKFDIRQWVLVRSVAPLKVFVFSECYLRLCNSMYDVGDLKDRQRHISNWQVNKHGRNVVDGACVSHEDFKAELQALTGEDAFWDERLLPQLKRIVVETMRAGKEKLQPRHDSFELYGFDLMVDEDMRMWLLEVNLSPGCEGRTPFLERMLTRMSKRLVEVAMLGNEEPDGEQPDWLKVCDEGAEQGGLPGPSAAAVEWRTTAIDLTVHGQAMRLPSAGVGLKADKRRMKAETQTKTTRREGAAASPVCRSGTMDKSKPEEDTAASPRRSVSKTEVDDEHASLSDDPYADFESDEESLSSAGRAKYEDDDFPSESEAS
eukprot:TRINITY_DN3823_c0_g1_i1.p1 TRINITY_DN3823_c0_g1~~TRINITY_DN3823_c0_g1_i1.p1  ORF type:complete len:907 (-),score=215.11 TRINITY_DN3823_c0_g1_i1:76-2796(-)